MTGSKEKGILRTLAGRYSEIASLEIQKERLGRYARTNARQEVRPVVLIDEVPWGEIPDEELRPLCESQEGRALEERLRRTLYQWDHFQVDMVVPPAFRVGKRTTSTEIGMAVKETRIESSTGSYAASHGYTDQLATDEDLEKLTPPIIAYDKVSTERALDLAGEIFSGLMPVEAVGTNLGFNIWDRIATLRGVDTLLTDLAERPDFMHRTAARIAEIAEAVIRQHIELDLLDLHPILLHCTPACTDELPAADFAGKTRLKDVWGRCSAQIFCSVSPAMHDEFDLTYNQELFGGCGLLYYGCCEPLDRKIDILRKRFPNLRKVSITPWADPDRAADAIARDYVLAAKPNPAFVNSPTFDPDPVAKEIRRFLEACRRNGTTCELVLKDVSTIANRTANLTQWAETVRRVVDEFYG